MFHETIIESNFDKLDVGKRALRALQRFEGPSVVVDAVGLRMTRVCLILDQPRKKGPGVLGLPVVSTV